jgi:transposase
MRKLPAAAQEERRRQAVGLRQRGLTYEAIAEQVGLSRTGVINLCQRFAAEGAKGLVGKPRGRKPDEPRRLDAAQEAEVQELIRRHTPDELGLPFALRSRAAVGMLIARPPLRRRTRGAHGRQVPGALGLQPAEADPARLRAGPGGGAALAAAGLPGDRGTSQAGPRRRGLGRRDRPARG